MSSIEPEWLKEHRAGRPYRPVSDALGLGLDKEWDDPLRLAEYARTAPKLLRDVGFSNHANNNAEHISPFDEGKILWGTTGINVSLLQPINEEAMKKTLSRTLRATNGIHPDEVPDLDRDTTEMLKGGLQTALESQVVVFEISGVSRTFTHQIVRSRRAAFHQQSQRATWYGDRPNVRMPISVVRAEDDYEKHRGDVELAWRKALLACWEAYKVACDAGISYQDARYILPEGTTNYIICEYTLREFLNVYAYRACSGFSWEMVHTVREMGRVLIEAHPFLEPYVKISCEKGEPCKKCLGSGFLWADGVAADHSEVKRYYREPESNRTQEMYLCFACGGTSGRKCHFQGWENVENFCDKPQALQSNRIFLPNPKYRIGG